MSGLSATSHSRSKRDVMITFTSYYKYAVDLNDDTSIIWIPCSNTIPFWFNRLNTINVPYDNRLAPPWNIINPFKNGDITYDVFKTKYIEYLNSKYNRDEILSWLNSIQEKYSDRILVFLCYEKDDKQCHRTILCDWLGVNAGELSSIT